MNKLPYGRYSKEFREETVKLVIESGLSVFEVFNRLSLPKSTLTNWLSAYKSGKLKTIGENQKPKSESEIELAFLKRELAIVKMERDILKKETAYFAKESMQGAL